MSRPLFKLSPRLALCASLVRPGRKLADIGTDHAYLPIWLLRNGKLSSALAADINSGPLEAAEKNGKKYGVEEQLSIRLSDGLKEVAPDEAEDIVIAGMGGEVILGIISETEWLKDSDKLLILQPMSSVPELRLGLAHLGFRILEERAVMDGGKVYSAFTAAYIGGTLEQELLYPYLGMLKPGDEATERYVQKVIRELENQLKGAIHNGEQQTKQRLEKLIKAIQYRFS